MAEEVHVNDRSTIRVTFKDAGAIVNISSADPKQIVFQKPGGGSILTKDGSFVTDGSNGELQYTMASGEIDIKGVWRVQGYVNIGGKPFRSDIKTFTVYSNIE